MLRVQNFKITEFHENIIYIIHFETLGDEIPKNAMNHMNNLCVIHSLL